jgi:DNA helicase-2/ATP-dependent DNA helicase PcrA
VVLSNATVAEIARAQPRNPRELSRISGIGPTKLERYGDEILRIVNSRSEGAAADP